jgi:hypothetical protein
VISNTTRAGIGDGNVSLISADHDGRCERHLRARRRHRRVRAGFGVAVGASAGVNIMSNTVEAFIGDAIVNVADGVDVVGRPPRTTTWARWPSGSAPPADRRRGKRHYNDR